MNLRDRLLRIQSASKDAQEIKIVPAVPNAASCKTGEIQKNNEGKKIILGFTEVLRGTHKRTLRIPLQKHIMDLLHKDLSHKDLPVIIPDIFHYPHSLKAENIVFFDLETTGLSGGAGTVAFLAAFGKFVCNATVLEVEQYLLEDQAFENGFIETVMRYFNDDNNNMPHNETLNCKNHKLFITYNGKSFDSQILKSRCIMHRIPPPEFFHADLLHPARCLWKKKLESCSQAEIEKIVLNIERKDDIPGSLAPEIWFSFLKTGATKELLGICDHNVSDIQGLASIFTALTRIAVDPSRFSKAYNVDIEALAFRFRRYNNGTFYANNMLMEEAALAGGAKAARCISIVEEWQCKNYERALFWTQTALLSNNLTEAEKADFNNRKARLCRKLGARN